MARQTGGCLCGHIRYTVTGAADWPHYCSCSQCQKWAGAPVVAWVTFPKDTVTFDGPGGEPRLYRSSKKTRRGFCPQCGGSILATDDGGDEIFLTVASLDDSSGMEMESYSFRGEAPKWLKIHKP